jgi:hypothetical protein
MSTRSESVLDHIAVYLQFFKPTTWREFFVAEVLADARPHHKERLHDNQPEWTRCTRGAQQEGTAQRELL